MLFMCTGKTVNMTHSKGHRSSRCSRRRAGRERGHKTEQDEAAVAVAATATWTALGCGQVQSSLMSLHMPHATCHNCNVPSCNAPIVVSSVLVKYVLPACGCPDLSLSLSLSISVSLPLTLTWLQCCFPWQWTEPSFVLIWLLYAFAFLSPCPLPVW